MRLTRKPPAPVIARLFLILSLAAAPWASGADKPSLDASVARAILDYGERLQVATDDLTATRARITEERAPLMDAIREAEEKIAALEADLSRLTVEKATAQERAQKGRAEDVILQRNLGYVASVVLEGLKHVESSLRPGETDTTGASIAAFRQRVEQATQPATALVALEAAGFVLDRLEQDLGGHTVRARSMREGDNRMIDGTLVYAGPATYFRSDSGELFGVVRTQRGSPYVVTRAIPGWTSAQAAALAAGEATMAPIDASGGMALKLLDTKGSLWAEVQKGGTVGYIILALGLVAIALVAMKLADLRKLAVDTPALVQQAMVPVARGDRPAAQAALGGLKETTRDLLATGLKHLDAPRALLEEHLEAFVLRHRLLQERRLPLLAVIATAGPLLGLLGTVTGMIKTFTLITVYGSGSAARLSGGISEALVATALGLAVAIPALVTHGFLSHRIHRGIALLERYAVELVAAIEESRGRRGGVDS